MVSKKLLGIAALAAVVVVGIAVGSSLFAVAGWTSISLSQIDYISNDPELAGKAWSLTFALTGQGDYAVGNIRASQVVDYTDYTQAKYDFKIEATTTDMSCNYAITSTDTKIYNLDAQTKTCWLGLNCQPWSPLTECGLLGCPGAGAWDKKCFDMGGVWFTKKGGTWDYTCWFHNPVATYGTLRTPSEIFSADFTLTKQDGTQEKATISNIGATSASLGTIGKIYWAGNLISGEHCPEARSQTVVAAYYQGKWRLIDEERYRTYATQRDVLYAEYIKKYQDGVISKETAMTNYNNFATTALQSKSFYFYSYDNKILATGTPSTVSATSGNVKMVVDKPVIIPVINMKVKAEWLGIVQLAGKPEIVSVSPAEFTTGKTGRFAVLVKNAGAVGGDFGAFAECPGFGSTPTTWFRVEAGQQTTIYLDIQGSCDKDTSESCKITVFDRQNPNNKDTESSDAKCTPLKVCEAGKRRCNYDLLEECDPAGSKWNLVKNCAEEQAQCIATAEGTFICYKRVEECNTDADCDDKDTKTTDICIKPLFGKSYCDHKIIEPSEDYIRYVWIAIVAALFGAIGYAFAKIKGMSKPSTLAIVAAVIGGILAFWWTGLGFWGQLAVGIGGVASAGLIIVLIIIGVIAFTFRGVVVGKK